MKYLDHKHNEIDDTDQLSENKKPKKYKNIDYQDSHNQTASPTLPKQKEKVDISPIKKYKKSKLILSRITLTNKMMFVDNLSTMLKAGLPLAPALRTLSKETKNRYLKEILLYLENHVENGQALSKGMKKYPEIFSDIMIATVEVGEHTGMLPDSLRRLADNLKSQKKLRSKVIGALMYPIIVLIALVAVSLLLALFVFPQLITIFQDAKVKLPFVLVAVQFLNEFLQSYYWYVLGGLIAVIILFKIIFKLPKPKLWLHFFILKIPFIGRIAGDLALTRFAGNLNSLLASGLDIIKSLEVTSKTLNNLKYRRETLAMTKELERGLSLDTAMSERPHLFPSLAIQLCQVGEKTGELEDILKKISKYYEERVNNVLANLSTILEPVLLIAVGVAVGFIALSVLGPMYELTLTFAN
ncbi:MAG: hypothetical protein COV55_02145 [Candidatus Komeilibacteria bacterium CG11_big_fil_rev_8_21_14_0_20_36_20]|uniref:Type II secretion system protein GspF domain-containing protein n=1 Tax=Candidatus Komeilibacteria bacterium CG11_big_fil_rev_8_21_14_0_20_36_20 TaxID=1974477 RepID=A0A2H0NDE6_9BACT|nr:MAG: hypothetical protein COV55_02145 [Candidatus Komeilibacteria bacterium CG11_big_fil_rev_8_21_14_0_20_36_20]PIR81597.1 MAG: hypothetical protein COU21_02955 [Candidatus Komeilibacteria bacterium CG10_big_fil_rev_8_21_14_0_10_36_65]PJC55435.1 MAG: hypothetical protein CO027_02255 [Candidatus Komeilibacteria bacterium CG_4_9_14_0_2_um_filter_36_13]